MRKSSLAVAFLLLVSMSLLGTTILPNVGATTLYVGGGGPGNYTDIQDAIDAANPGDTVYVFGGSYPYMSVDKPLTLIGNGAGIGGGTSPHTFIGADSVNVTGFHFAGMTGPHITIMHVRGNDCNISGNSFGLGSIGIHLDRSTNITIRDNNLGTGIYITGDSVEHWNSHTIDMSNRIWGGWTIYVKNANGGSVTSSGGQIILANCTDYVIENRHTGWSSMRVLVGFSSGISIVNNTAVDNPGPDPFGMGITLYKSHDNLIANNRISMNFWGVEMRYSNNNVVRHNTFTWNFAGVDIHSSKNNTIYHNNFIDNGGYTNSAQNQWDNGYPSGGNYWSFYSGIDEFSGPAQNQPGPDGIGDTPFGFSGGGLDRYPLIEMPRELDIRLEKGPNLISVPFAHLCSPRGNALGSISFDKAWWYDSVAHEWKWEVKDKTYSRGLLNVSRTMGIWVNVTETSYLTATGIVRPQTTIHLHRGWNLVGFPSFNTDYTIADLKADTGATRVEGYDPVPPFFLRVLGVTEALQAGHGYWVKVDAHTVWTVSA